MFTLFIRKLEKDLFSLGVLEPFAVATEEPMRPSLATDTDHERSQVVDSFDELIRTRRKQAVRSPLEKEKRRPRFKLWILRQQFPITSFERTEVLLLFRSETFKNPPRPSVGGDPGGASVEL